MSWCSLGERRPNTAMTHQKSSVPTGAVSVWGSAERQTNTSELGRLIKAESLADRHLLLVRGRDLTAKGSIVSGL
jgi:hypothetical protein